MKKITTLRGKMFNGILSLTLILTAGFFNSANAQLIDGDNCDGSGNYEWAQADAYIDYSFVNPGTADILKVWGVADFDSLKFAIARRKGGNSSFKLYFDTDCNSSTGDQSYYRNGADVVMFFDISSTFASQIYVWNGSGYTLTSNSFSGMAGDTSCSTNDGGFIEMEVAVADLVDPCDLGSCGGVTWTSAESVSGGSFTSNPVDTIELDVFAFINDVPVPVLTGGGNICDGITVDLDASGSTENNPGNETSYDDVAVYEWDFDYDATTGFSTSATGSTTSTTLNYNASNQFTTGVTKYTIALMVTDVFGCQDSITNIDYYVYNKPTVTFAAVVDIDSAGTSSCDEFSFTFEGSATDYAGSAFSSLNFRTADGNLGSSSASGTFGDIAYNYTYGECRWSSALIGELDKVIAIDPVSGCSDSAVMSPPVPVELISFTGEVIGADAHIKWQTASELNSDYFIVEKSLDGKNFTYVQNVTAAGNSSEILDYMIIDPNMEEGNVYYRLTQYDFNGEFEVFDPIVLNKADGQGRIKVSPNPTSDVVNVNIPASKYNGELVILDLAGKQVFSTNVNANVNATSVDIDVAALPKGMYYVRFGNEKEGFTSQMLQLL